MPPAGVARALTVPVPAVARSLAAAGVVERISRAGWVTHGKQDHGNSGAGDCGQLAVFDVPIRRSGQSPKLRSITAGNSLAGFYEDKHPAHFPCSVDYSELGGDRGCCRVSTPLKLPLLPQLDSDPGEETNPHQSDAEAESYQENREPVG